MQLLDRIGIMVKPTHRCNLNCIYCYDKKYRDEIKNDMSLDTVEEISKKLGNFAKSVNWIWHGGEALLMGKEWLTEACEIVEKYIDTVDFKLQTNGTLLDDDMIETMIKLKINVGVSYDGTAHDVSRGSGNKVFSNFKKYFNKTGNCGLITVIGYHNVDKLIDTYNLYKENGIKSFSYNIATPYDMNGTIVRPLENPDEFLDKYLKFFDYWLSDKDGVSERTFMTFIDLILGSKSLPCYYDTCVGKWLAFNPNGDIYPCDRWYPYNLGNISDYKNIANVFYHKNFLMLKQQQADKRLNCLKTCDFSEYCFGGCNGSSLTLYGDATKPDPNFCYIFKAMIKHVFVKIKDLSIEELDNINPAVSKKLKKSAYRGLSTIKQIIDYNWEGRIGL
ncbi:radical SAM protein [Clostridium sp. 'deep sea']|uniref:radical SAM/SPASM domain-containing protein n=1 Tax=Clostridium sp. 'deep sea' TaxID=2779445 RepID=UPI001896402C|nr:radical SAM protein [Clostridium sp. 'deep sea']QOR33929.1 radical SAM protein [Clostridium sp. 'deep sea']